MFDLSYFKRKKIFWVAVIGTALLSYLFLMTHYSVSIDDEVHASYYQDNVALSANRGGYVLTQLFLNAYRFLPTWKECLGVFLLLAVCVVWAGYLQVLSKGYFKEPALAIMCCLYLSYPLFADAFLFTGLTLNKPWTHLISLLGIALLFDFVELSRSKWRLAASIALIVYSFMYEKANVVLLVSFLLIGWFAISLSKGAAFRFWGFLKRILFMCGILVVALFISIGAVALLQHLFNAPSAGYTSAYLKYDFNNFFASFTSFISRLIKQLVTLFKIDLGTRVFYIASLVLVAAGVWVVIKKRVFTPLVLGIGLFLVAMLPYLATGTVNLPYRMFEYRGLLVGFTGAVVYMLLQGIAFRWFKLKNLVAAAACLLVLNQSMAMNQLFYDDYTRYQMDLELMHQVLHDVKLEAGPYNTKPILFAGWPDRYRLPSRQIQSESMLSFARLYSPRDEFEYKRPYHFANMHGYNIYPPEKGSYNVNEARRRVLELTDWPMEGSIGEYDDYILVRLGRPHYGILDGTRQQILQRYESAFSVKEYAYTWNWRNDTDFNINGYALTEKALEYNKTISLLLLSEKGMQYLIPLPPVLLTMEDTELGNRAANRFNKAVSFTNAFEPDVYEVYLLVETDSGSQTIQLKETLRISQQD